jgi:transcriptional regulator with XRE-family HTH domain
VSSKASEHACHERIALVRNHFELSQEKMAQRVGLSTRGYQNYERGERETPVSLVRALYDVFSVDPVWLLTGEGAMIADKDVRYRLNQTVLDHVVATVDRIEKRLPKRLTIRQKARLIGLLYEQSRLLADIADADVNASTLPGLLM